VKKIVILLLFVVISNVLLSQNKADFPNWLQGVWEIKSDSGSSYEEWKLVKDGFLSGRTFRFFSSDTVVFDTMNIKMLNSGIVFEMTANIKNTRVFAGFPLQRPDPKLWKFESPVTDYPKNINYMRLATDTVYVWTEAIDENSACMDYLMIRIKDE
jgi:hypothetical protein